MDASTQKPVPEALRIAAALEYCDASVARQAINELRRLHVEAVDATRYRWLRAALSNRSGDGKSHWFCCIAEGRPEELDEAIDQALAASK